MICFFLISPWVFLVETPYSATGGFEGYGIIQQSEICMNSVSWVALAIELAPTMEIPLEGWHNA